MTKSERLDIIVKGIHSNPVQGLIDLYKDGEIDLKEVQFQITLPPKIRDLFRKTIFDDHIIKGINNLTNEEIELMLDVHEKHCKYTDIEMQIMEAWKDGDNICVRLNDDQTFYYSKMNGWYKNRIERNVIFNNAGGNASKKSMSYKLSLKKEIIDELQITEDFKSVEIFIRNGEVVIKRSRSF